MGFCLLNNVAIVAAALADRGERVCIVDYDAHHGNGTQDRSSFVIPGSSTSRCTSGRSIPAPVDSTRSDRDPALGTTINFPLPAGTTGDVYLAAVDEVVAPEIERFDPTWVLISAGFDAHRDDPLTGIGLTAGDFADLTARIAAFAPQPGRLVAFLEGGYGLDGLRDSVAASLPALIDGPSVRPEPASSGGPGRNVVDAARDLHRR